MLQKNIPFPFPIYFPPLHNYCAYVACQIHVGTSHASITVLGFFLAWQLLSSQFRASPVLVLLRLVGNLLLILLKMNKCYLFAGKYKRSSLLETANPNCSPREAQVSEDGTTLNKILVFLGFSSSYFAIASEWESPEFFSMLEV